MRFKIEEENQLLVPVSIGVSMPRKRALETNLEVVPKNYRGIALIDTGATLSVVYRPVISHLNLLARGYCTVYGFSPTEGEDAKYPNYDISFSILDAFHDETQLSEDTTKFEFETVQVVSPPCRHVQYDMLIGMDILSTLRLTVDWPQKWFDLEKARIQ